MKKDVMIFIQDVKYYKDQNSLVVVGKEVETKKPITQQITIMAFLSGTGLFSDTEIENISNDPDRCRYLANQLKVRREPFKLVFEDAKTEEDEI
jgi:hypothetical protein